jgi:hypothetical protein
MSECGKTVLGIVALLSLGVILFNSLSSFNSLDTDKLTADIMVVVDDAVDTAYDMGYRDGTNGVPAQTGVVVL